VNAQKADQFQGAIEWSERALRALLWVLVAYSASMWAIVVYDWIRHPLARSPYSAFQGDPAFRAFALFIGAPLIALIGVLIVRKQRSNLIGPLLLLWSGGYASWGLSTQVDPALYMIVSLPIQVWWLALIFAPVFFPDGHACPRWLSPALLALTLGSILAGLSSFLLTPTLDQLPGQPRNPFHLATAQSSPELWTRAYLPFFLLLLPWVFISPILRYRRANFVQRQQIKAFTWTTAVILIPYVIFYLWAGATYGSAQKAPPLLMTVLGAAIGLIGLVPPIAIGYAILRHKLFDIDVVIRRTLIYTAVSVMLAAIFYGSVLVLQRLLTVVTGQQSPVAIVASTLVIAALFSPLRRRVQDFVDRRFYRRKYDAQRVLSEFASVARDETDMDRLASVLEGAVEETMQPSSISTWVART
jgi:cytochrome b subunit of formate dehydrogenase